MKEINFLHLEQDKTQNLSDMWHMTDTHLFLTWSSGSAQVAD